MTLPRLRLLHETNPQKYFPALYLLARDGKITLTGAHRYSVAKEWLRSWMRDKTPLTTRTHNALSDAWFRASLGRVRNETVVMGFAPWDWRILIYRRLARHNRILYHTSWHDWHTERTPRQPRPAAFRKYIQSCWLRFLSAPNVHTIAITPAVAESLTENWGVASTIIPHAVPELFFKAAETRSTLHRKTGLSLLYVGEISEKKGIRTLLDQMSVLTSLGVTLTVVGDGPLVSEVKAAGPSVTFRGAIWDRTILSGIMAEHDVLMLLSRRTANWEELFGIVIAEALAAGLAVIASDHIGPKSILAPVGGAGLYDEDDIHGVGECLRMFAHDRSAVEQLRSAQRPVADSYRIDTISAAWTKAIGIQLQ